MRTNALRMHRPHCHGTNFVSVQLVYMPCGCNQFQDVATPCSDVTKQFGCLVIMSDVNAGGLFLPETPNNLVERGYLSEAKSVLQKVRGTKDVDVEFDTIVLAHEALKGMENPWRAIFRRRNRPQLILAIAMPFFQ